MKKTLFIALLYFPSILFGCGFCPTDKDVIIFISFLVLSISLFVFSIIKLRQGKSKLYILLLIPFLIILVPIGAFTYMRLMGLM